MLKKSLFLCFALVLYGCMGQTNKENKKNMDNETLIAQFEKQDCRLEFVEHQLFYNGKVVKLDQPLSYYEGLFGKDYKLFRSGDIVIFKNLPITLNKGMDSIVDKIRIQFYYYEEFTRKRYYEEEGFIFLEDQYMLIDGIAVNKDTDPNWLNNMLIDNHKKPFKRVVRSYSGAMERQYTDNAYNWLEYIYISLWGRESDNKVNYIDYGNASTDSD